MGDGDTADKINKGTVMRKSLLLTLGLAAFVFAEPASASQSRYERPGTTELLRLADPWLWSKPDPEMQSRHVPEQKRTRVASVGHVNFSRWEHGEGTRRRVKFTGVHKPGSVVISTKRRKLWYVLHDGDAIEYGIGVGRLGFTWGGKQRISRKAKWPAWVPPAEMRKRQPGLPRRMEGGPRNPLGARALYLGNTLYRIHGTNQAHTIGQAMSSGCIRMMNSDVVDLYNRVPIGATVYVYQ